MKVIVVSHGSYARGLVDTVQMIAGKQEDLEAFGLESEESVDTLKEKIRQSIEQASQEEFRESMRKKSVKNFLRQHRIQYGMYVNYIRR